MARTTTWLGLKVWDNALDEFHYTDLRDNWDAIEAHDHSGSGKGLPIGETALRSGAVTAEKIATDAVASDKLQASSVVTAKIAAEAVVKGKLAPDAVNAFLKLFVVADRKVNFGRYMEPNWSATSYTGTIPHGLGAVPVFVMVHPDTASGALRVASVTGMDSTNITYRVEANNGSSLTSAGTIINWIVIA